LADMPFSYSIGCRDIYGYSSTFRKPFSGADLHPLA
jgi:hypothetical protein